MASPALMYDAERESIMRDGQWELLGSK